MSSAAHPLEPKADWLSYALVGCVLATLSRTAGGHLAIQLPLYGMLAGLVITRGRRRVNLNWVGVLLLLAPLPLLLFLVDVQGRGGNQFLRSFYLAYGVVELALLQLYARPSAYARGRVIYLTAAGMLFVSVGLPDYIGALPGWTESGPMHALVGAPSTLSPHGFYMASVAIWGLLTVAALRPKQAPSGARGSGGRAFAWIVCAAVALGLAASGTYVLRAYYTELSEVYYRLVGDVSAGSGGGFSDRGDLGSVTDLQGKDGGREIALRAVGDAAPGYLRARSFLDYTRGGWEPGDSMIVPLPGSGRAARPDTPPPAEDAEPSLWVYPESDHADIVFTPLHTGAVQLPAEGVRVLPGWCLRTYEGDASGGIPVYAVREPWHYDAEREVYRQLPEDPQLIESLDMVWERIATTSPDAGSDHDARVAALKAYFERSYTYKYGITFSGETDPLTEFLREKKHGHCELFASSGALLLRRVGIATRYTTGFLCMERSPIREQLWVARNRAAHAWVEAYHPQRGWEVVEFTPAGGLPGVDPPSSGTALLEAIGGWISEVWGALRGNLSELPGRLLATLQSFVGWIAGSVWRWGALLLFVGAVVAWRLWRRRAPRKQRAKLATAPLHPELRALRDRFLELEAALRKAGLPRGAGETVREFHTRITAVEWPLLDRDRNRSLAFLQAYAVDRYRAYPEDA